MFCSFEAIKTWDLDAEEGQLNLVLLATIKHFWELRLPVSISLSGIFQCHFIH